MATMIRLLPTRFATRPYRSTDAVVFITVEARGAICVGEQQFELTPHDIVVVPDWMSHALRADDELVLFSYSDRATQEKIDLFREQRLSN